MLQSAKSNFISALEIQRFEHKKKLSTTFRSQVIMGILIQTQIDTHSDTQVEKKIFVNPDIFQYNKKMKVLREFKTTE